MNYSRLESEVVPGVVFCSELPLMEGFSGELALIAAGPARHEVRIKFSHDLAKPEWARLWFDLLRSGEVFVLSFDFILRDGELTPLESPLRIPGLIVEATQSNYPGWAEISCRIMVVAPPTIGKNTKQRILPDRSGVLMLPGRFQ